MMRHETEIRGHRLAFRTWTYGMKQQALRESTTWEREGTELKPDVDPWTLNDLMLVGCLTEWDLVNEAGQPLPITVESIHGLEPPELVEEMIAFCQEINGVTVDERKKIIEAVRRGKPSPLTEDVALCVTMGWTLDQLVAQPAGFVERLSIYLEAVAGMQDRERQRLEEELGKLRGKAR
jgi:hypothetical protein